MCRPASEDLTANATETSCRRELHTRAAMSSKVVAHRHRVDFDTLLLQVLWDEISGLRRFVGSLDADDSDPPRSAGELYNAWLRASENF